MPLTDLDFEDRRRRVRRRQSAGILPQPFRFFTVVALGSAVFFSALAASAMMG